MRALFFLLCFALFTLLCLMWKPLILVFALVGAATTSDFLQFLLIEDD